MTTKERDVNSDDEFWRSVSLKVSNGQVTDAIKEKAAIQLIEYAENLQYSVAAVESVIAKLFDSVSPSVLSRRLGTSASPTSYLCATLANASRDEERRNSRAEMGYAVTEREQLTDKFKVQWVWSDLVNEVQSGFLKALTSGYLDPTELDLVYRIAKGESLGDLAREHDVKYATMAQRAHRAVQRFRRALSGIELPENLDALEATFLIEALEKVAEEFRESNVD